MRRRPRRCSALSERLNALQFLTIRRYLVLMFAALIVLLLDRGGVDMMAATLITAVLAQGDPDVSGAADRAARSSASRGRSRRG